MSTGPQDAGGALPRATQLIADVRTRDEALRQEAEHLVRLREAARTAAEQEAAAIVTKARADIRRVISDARAAVLALKSQLDEIEEPRPEVDAALLALGDDFAADALERRIGDEDELPESVREVQGELQRLFAESEMDLDGVVAETAAPAVSTVADTRAPLEDEDATPARTRGRRMLTIFAVMAVLGAGGVGAWWYAGRPAGARQNTAVVIPRAPALKLVPSAVTDIPTVNGTLIALPPRDER